MGAEKRANKKCCADFTLPLTKLLSCRAAFQFGIKMSEGRKTRRAGPKDEKAKLDRDWQKISQVGPSLSYNLNHSI